MINLETHENLNSIKVADMNEYVLATPTTPLIGTYALATCLGLIMYDEHNHFALAHISSDYKNLISQMLRQMINTAPIHVIIIPGYDTYPEKIYEIIAYLKDHNNFSLYDFDIEIKYIPEYLEENTQSIEFAFDTRTKTFIKVDYDKILFKGGKKNARN